MEANAPSTTYPPQERRMTFAWLQRTLLGVAFILLGLHLFVYLVYTAELLRFPFDYDQGEGFELVDAVYLSEGRLPYQDSDVYPFYSSNYPPVFRLMLAPFAAIFGPEYWYGRLLSFLSTLIVAGLIAFAIYRAEKRPEIGMLLGLAFLASNYIYHIGPLFRQHYLMVMFETLAVVLLASLFSLPEGRQRQRRLMLGLLVLLIAGYTKQLAAVTVVAVFIWLFIRQPRLALVYAPIFGAITGAVLLVLNILTGGEWWNNAIAANVNEYIPGQFIGLAQQFVRLHWAILVLAGLLAVYELYFARLSLYAVWWSIALASTVGSGTWGAGDSYFATSLVASCILAGIFIARSLNGTWTFPDNFYTKLVARYVSARPIANRWQLIAGLGGIALIIVYSLTVVKIPTSGPIFGPFADTFGVEPRPGHRYPLYDAAGWTQGYAVIGHLPSQADHNAGWQIVERIRQTDGPVMSEEAGFSLQAGREVITNPTQLRNLYSHDLLDTEPLVTMIENQAFGLIIFRARFYPEPVLAAVDNAYQPVEVIPMNGFDYELWRPEPTWETRRIMRNYLEAPDAASLEVALPATVTDPENWLQASLARWAWQPIPTEGNTSADLCSPRRFERRGQQTAIRICQGEIRMAAPQ